MNAIETIQLIKKLQHLNSIRPRKLGPIIGLLVYGNSLDVKTVLFALGITEDTWMEWITAGNARPKTAKETLLKFKQIVEDAMKSGELPLTDSKENLRKATTAFLQKYIAEIADNF